MKSAGYPLLFAPVYKEYIWGGQRLAAQFGRTDTPAVCAESWEISAHPDGMSRVSNGPLAGSSLADVAAMLGPELTGSGCECPDRFPLLFKLIDARENLSVQVHPNERNAGAVGGEPKTEAWYVLDRTSGARLYAGIQRGTTAESFRVDLANGTAQQKLYPLPVEPDQALFIPGGLVHAIGAGCLIFEVQQTSNTTYRLYDWDRRDAAGQSRPLHIEQAFAVIDAALPEPRLVQPRPATRTRAGNQWSRVLACRFFCLRRLDVAQPENLTLDGSSFQALFALRGSTRITAGGCPVTLHAGTSCLIPAAAGSYSMQPLEAASSLLVTTLGTETDTHKAGPP